MDNCLPHTGELNDNWEPITADGQPYLPGERLCGHKDCVNPDHIKGTANTCIECPNLVKERNLCAKHYTQWRQNNGLGLKVDYQMLCDIINEWDKDFTTPHCRVPNCRFELRAKGLCRNHYQSWYKQTDTINRRTSQLNTKQRFAIQDQQLAQIVRKDTKTPNCEAPNCNNPTKYLNVCYKHYKRYQRWVKANNTAQAA